MQITFDNDNLEPLIRKVMNQVLAQRDADGEKFSGRLALTEPEAAAAIGIRPYALRDCRLRGEISGAKAGKKVVYSIEELKEFLGRNQTGNR